MAKFLLVFDNFIDSFKMIVEIIRFLTYHTSIVFLARLGVLLWDLIQQSLDEPVLLRWKQTQRLANLQIPDRKILRVVERIK